MPFLRKPFSWRFLSITVALSFLAGLSIVVWISQQGPHFPPCEAMRPYIEYHGTTYFAVPDGTVLTSSDLGHAITTIGDGSDQAKSCLPSGITVYSVKGYPPPSRLAADFGGLTLFEPSSLTPTPSPSASRTSIHAAFHFPNGWER